MSNIASRVVSEIFEITGLSTALDGKQPLIASGAVGQYWAYNKTWQTLNYLAVAGLSTVAHTGAYADLSGVPTLATVASTGAYTDLSGRPTLATVATSGSYADLSNKPTLFSGAFSALSGVPTTIAGYGIIDAVNSSQIGAANGVAPLGADSKIASSYLPPLAITDTFVVDSQAAMLALTAQTGDVAVRTELNKSYILRVNDATVLGNWQELLTPTDVVLSVNGQFGAVSLSAADVGALTQAAADALYKSLAYQPTAANISDSTAAGRALLTGANAAAQRTALSLGDAATKNVGTGTGNVLYVDSNGRVGIGMTPSNPLHVAGDIVSTTAVKATSLIEGGLIRATGGGFVGNSSGTFTIDAPSITGGRLALDTSGHLGVGVPSPLSAIHVSAKAVGESTALLDNIASQTAPTMRMRNMSSTLIRNAAYMVSSLPVSTDASRTGLMILGATDYAADREGLRIEADGSATRIGFYGSTAVTKPAVTGSKASGAALTSLLSALVSLGLITDSTTA